MTAGEATMLQYARDPSGAPIAECELAPTKARGRAVHVVHATEAAVGGDVAVDGEDLDGARALILGCLDQLAGYGVRADGQVLLHAGLAAFVDGSSSRELLRRTRSDVLMVDPDAAVAMAAEPAGAR